MFFFLSFFYSAQTFLTNIFSNVVLLTKISSSSSSSLFFCCCCCLFLVPSRCPVRLVKTKARTQHEQFRWLAEIYEWGKINVEILLFWKSCCNEALKRKFFVITCSAIADIVTDALRRGQYFARQTEIHLKVSNLFLESVEKNTQTPATHTPPHTHIRHRRWRKKRTTDQSEEEEEKLHWKYFGLVILAQIVRRHFNWVYYTRS